MDRMLTLDAFNMEHTMEQNKPLSARQAAAFCQVNFKTVLKWIEDGKLRSYKLPDSGVNRVMVSDLLDFMKKFGFPIPPVLGRGGVLRVLVVDDEPNAVNMIRRVLRSGEFEIEEAHDGFEAGRRWSHLNPMYCFLILKCPG
jgi:two-component system, OmpR family, response regulator VicR